MGRTEFPIAGVLIVLAALVAAPAGSTASFASRNRRPMAWHRASSETFTS